jgi:hypothetical protein
LKIVTDIKNKYQQINSRYIDCKKKMWLVYTRNSLLKIVTDIKNNISADKLTITKVDKGKTYS